MFRALRKSNIRSYIIVYEHIVTHNFTCDFQSFNKFNIVFHLIWDGTHTHTHRRERKKLLIERQS